MSPPAARRVALLLAPCACGGLLALLGLTPHPPTTTPTTPSQGHVVADALHEYDRRPAAIPAEQARGQLRGDADVHTRGAQDLTAEHKVAQRFARALLRYELGRTDEATQRALRTTCDRRLANRLLATPPRLPLTDSPTPARLAALDLLGSDGQRSEFTATLRRGARRSLLTVAVERRHGRPWVIAVR